MLMLTVIVSSVPQAYGQQQTESNAITRAEATMLLILARIPNIPVVRNVGQFKDVQVGVWHEPYMLYAEKIGIVESDEQGFLYPGSIVSRIEFLKMLTWTFGLESNLPHEFTDVPGHSWYNDYVGIAWNSGLFALSRPNVLEPTRALSRGEAQRIISYYQAVRLTEQQVRLEQRVAKDQSAGKLALYTVISTRRQNTVLVERPQVPVQQEVQTVTLRPLSSRYELRQQVIALVNEVRAKYGLQPLSYNAALESSAQEYSDRMAVEGFFGHTAPNGQTLRQRIATTGYYDRTFSPECRCIKGYALGENLARGQKTPKEAVDAWLASPSHRDAILNPQYQDLGVGISAGIWVQHFGGLLLPE